MQFDPLQPLALLPSAVHEFVRYIRGEVTHKPEPVAVKLYDGDRAIDAASSVAGQKNLLAVVQIQGALYPWKLDSIASSVASLDANPAIGTILLNVTSPGGTVTGTPEAADAVRAVRDGGNTRIVALANGMMASAAMWIGAAADEVYVTPSGEAGSIGVITMYADWSKAYEDVGIKVDVMRTPAKKARFTGIEPLTDEMRQTLEKSLESAYTKFKRAMADNRGIRIDQVEGKFGGGEMLEAQEAVDAGLVDKVSTLDKLIAKLMTRRAPSSARAALARAELETLL